MKRHDYQLGYSEVHSESLYSIDRRGRKAQKILAVLDDYYSGDLGSLRVLDIGCSAGIISGLMSERVGRVVGMDIDGPAVVHAQKSYGKYNADFTLQDATAVALKDETFDVVICAQVYEHVPSQHSLMSEILRVLKPSGVCYFAAGNRICLIKPHYKLPLLSVIPRSLANRYVSIMTDQDSYYERTLFYWQLKKLVSKFDVIDYTVPIVGDPEKYAATDMLRPGSMKHKLALWAVDRAYWLCSTYIWLLRKPNTPANLH